MTLLGRFRSLRRGNDPLEAPSVPSPSQPTRVMTITPPSKTPRQIAVIAAEEREMTRILAFLSEEEDRQVQEVRDRLERYKKELEAFVRKDQKDDARKPDAGPK